MRFVRVFTYIAAALHLVECFISGLPSICSAPTFSIYCSMCVLVMCDFSYLESYVPYSYSLTKSWISNIKVFYFCSILCK